MMHIRVDETLKTQAMDILVAMEISLSDAIQVFLTHVMAKQGLSFELKVLNVETCVALTEAKSITKSHNACFASVLVDTI